MGNGEYMNMDSIHTLFPRIRNIIIFALCIVITLGLVWVGLTQGWDITFIFIGLISIAVLGFLYPLTLLMLLVLVLPLKSFPANSGPFSWSHLFAAILIISLAGRHFLRQQFLRMTGIEVPMVILLTIGIFSLSRSTNLGMDLLFLYSFVGLYLCLFVIYNLVHTPRHLWLLAVVLIASAILPTVVGFIQYYTQQEVFGIGPKYIGTFPRARGTLYNTSGLASLLAGCMMLLIGLIYEKRSMRSGFWLFILLVMSWSLYLTLSRGAVLGVLLSLTYLGIYRYRSGREKRLHIISRATVLILLILSFLFLLSSDSWMRSMDLRDLFEDTTSIVRQNEWKLFGNLLINHPIGNSSFSTYSKIGIKSENLLIPDQPHNVLVAVAALGGWIGVLTIAWLAGLMIRKYRQVVRSKTADLNVKAVAFSCQLTLLGFIPLWLTHGELFSDTPWLILGLLLAANKLANEKQERSC